MLKNKYYGYPEDSTFIDVVPSPGLRVAVTKFRNRDLNGVGEFLDLWEMKSNKS